jgi:hypothetical protein
MFFAEVVCILYPNFCLSGLPDAVNTISFWWSVFYSILMACAECDDSLLFSGTSSIPPCHMIFLSLFSTNYSSLLHQFILQSIFWSPPWSCCFQIHIQYSFLELYFLPFFVHVQTNIIYVVLLSLLWSV